MRSNQTWQLRRKLINVDESVLPLFYAKANVIYGYKLWSIDRSLKVAPRILKEELYLSCTITHTTYVQDSQSSKGVNRMTRRVDVLSKMSMESNCIQSGYKTPQIAIQMTEITTSSPLLSPPSYLKLHMPSVFSFQYAPVAECIPRLPTCGLPSVEVAPLFSSSSTALTSATGFGLFKDEVGTRCWMMVLLTAYL